MFKIYELSLFDPQLWLNISVLVSIIFGLCVITSNNPMYSILYLIGLFIGVAGYLYYIGLGIMSLLYLLIYVGAIAILFLFILSLLDVKVSELQAKSNSNDIPLVIIVTITLFYCFYNIYNINISILDVSEILDYRYSYKFDSLFNTLSLKSIAYVFNNVTELPLSLYYVLVDNWYAAYPVNELTSIGNLLYTEYAIVFILLGIILLLSIIGAIVVTKSI